MIQETGGFIARQFQMFLRADRKHFVLVHCQTIISQSCFIVQRHIYLIGFPITTIKPLIGLGLNSSWEYGNANKLCTLYLPSKTLVRLP